MKIQNLFSQIENLSKINLEHAIIKNDRIEMTTFSAILGLLETKENIFEKIKDFHTDKLKNEIDLL